MVDNDNALDLSQELGKLATCHESWMHCIVSHSRKMELR